jgi:hypothetical protein
MLQKLQRKAGEWWLLFPKPEGRSWPFLALGPPFTAGKTESRIALFMQRRSRRFSSVALAVERGTSGRSPGRIPANRDKNQQGETGAPTPP